MAGGKGHGLNEHMKRTLKKLRPLLVDNIKADLLLDCMQKVFPNAAQIKEGDNCDKNCWLLDELGKRKGKDFWTFVECLYKPEIDQGHVAERILGEYERNKAKIKSSVQELREKYLHHGKAFYRQTSRYERQKSDPNLKVYQMESKTRGVALIINNHEFHHPMFKDRHGTDEDCDRLRKCFEDNLGFHVTVLPNLRGQDMRKALKDFSAGLDNHPNSPDSCMVAIMTHGDENDVLFGVDGEKEGNEPKPGTFIQKEDLRNIFSSSNCRGMEDKPKFFIIQACRGVREDILREQQSANSDRSEPFVRLDIVQEEPDPPSLHASVGIHEGTLREQQPVHSDLSEPFVGRDTAVQAEQNPFFLHASVGNGEDIQTGQEGLENMSVRFRHPAQQASVNRSANNPTGQELCGLVQMRQDPSSCDQDPSSHDQDPSSRDQDPSSRDQDPSSCDQDPSSRDKHERADMVFWHATVDKFVAYRNVFIQVLVDVVEKHAEDYHVAELHTKILEKMEKEKPADHILTIPNADTQLSKLWYFNPLNASR